MKFGQFFTISEEKVEEIMKRVGEKCKNDKSFELELHNHPTETLKKEGLELQPGMRFQVVNTLDEANALPDNVVPLSFKNNKDSLSLNDLQKVAGGTEPTRWTKGEKDKDGNLIYYTSEQPRFIPD